MGGERKIMGYESLYMVSIPLFIELPRYTRQYRKQSRLHNLQKRGEEDKA